MTPTDHRGDDEFTRQLLETAGGPPPVPQEDVAAIKRAARAIWQQQYAGPERGVWSRRWFLPVAAALVAGLVLTWWALRPPSLSTAPIAAKADRISGTVIAEQNPVLAGDEIPVGAVLRTDRQSRAALRLAGGQSLRLDSLTTVRLISHVLVELERGGIYLDSPPNGSPELVAIRTSSGDFRPIGTQFEVRLVDAGSAYLRVREGRVVLERKNISATAGAGEELIVHRDGTITRGRLSSDDPSWEWVLAAAAMPDIEGRTLRWFLEWMARESGWKLSFANDQAASLSRTTILHGSIRDLSRDEALQSVMLGSGFRYGVSDGALIVNATGAR